MQGVGRSLVGIMGGHAAKRRNSIRWHRELAEAGYLTVTGGGLGIMEAAHLGVAFAKNDALAKLGKYPGCGELDDLMEEDGTIKRDKKADVIKARDWLEEALEVRTYAPPILPLSIATMPFATHYAKYYQNGLREEAF